MNDFNTKQAHLRAVRHTLGREPKRNKGEADGAELIEAAVAIGQLTAITVEQALVLLNTSYTTFRREAGKSPPSRARVKRDQSNKHVPKPARGRDTRHYYDPVKLKVWWEGRAALKRRPSKSPPWKTIDDSPLPSWTTGWMSYGPYSTVITHISMSGLKANEFKAWFEAGAVVEFMTVNEAMRRPWAIHAEWKRWFEPWKTALLDDIARADAQGLQASLPPASTPENIRL